LLTSGLIPDKDVAFLLVWLYAAVRISSIDGFTLDKIEHGEHPNQTRLIGRMNLLKGKHGNSYLVTIGCGCPDDTVNQLCPIHSARFSYKKLDFPLSQAEAQRIVTDANISAHSPRVTVTALLDQAMKTNPSLAKILHFKWINAHFFWNCKTAQMFEYYARNSQRILHELPTISILPFIRVCLKEGWEGKKKVGTPHDYDLVAPQHLIEIYNAKQIVPIANE